MKYKFKKELKIACTLDSSEAIMFGEGGQHKVQLDLRDEQDEYVDLRNYDTVEITFQIEGAHKGRYDFITGEAKQHKKQFETANGTKFTSDDIKPIGMGL